MFWMDRAWAPAMWVMFAVWLPFITVITIALLPFMKGLVVGFAWALLIPLAGPGETPGVLTMRLDGRGLDRRWKSVTAMSRLPAEVDRAAIAGPAGASHKALTVQRLTAKP